MSFRKELENVKRNRDEQKLQEQAIESLVESQRLREERAKKFKTIQERKDKVFSIVEPLKATVGQQIRELARVQWGRFGYGFELELNNRVEEKNGEVIIRRPELIATWKVGRTKFRRHDGAYTKYVWLPKVGERAVRFAGRSQERRMTFSIWEREQYEFNLLFN